MDCIGVVMYQKGSDLGYVVNQREAEQRKTGQPLQPEKQHVQCNTNCTGLNPANDKLQERLKFQNVSLKIKFEFNFKSATPT